MDGISLAAQYRRVSTIDMPTIDINNLPPAKLEDLMPAADEIINNWSSLLAMSRTRMLVKQLHHKSMSSKLNFGRGNHWDTPPCTPEGEFNI
jgi:hypothetical protein